MVGSLPDKRHWGCLSCLQKPRRQRLHINPYDEIFDISLLNSLSNILSSDRSSKNCLLFKIFCYISKLSIIHYQLCRRFMKIIKIKNDIRDETGRLLLAKNREVCLDDARINIYEKMGILNNVLNQTSVNNQEIKLDEEFKAKEFTTHSINSFSERNMVIKNRNVLNDAVDLIQNIIVESRRSNMGIYIKMLCDSDLAWIYSHSVNTTFLATAVALTINQNYNDIYQLAMETIIHDIGMTLVPHIILNKQGLLTASEYDAVKSHCELGKTLVNNQDPLYNSDIIMQHHERLDGSGYPLALKSNEICFQAKIVMIADVIDSATTDRPYKRAKSINDVFNELKEQKEKFDNDLVDVFYELVN